MVGVSFAVCRERYTSGSTPFSRLGVPGRLLMCHDSTIQQDYIRAMDVGPGLRHSPR